MKTAKRFYAPSPVEVVTTPAAALDDVATLVIALPENATGVRTLDLSPWLDQGIDEWVWACAGQLRVFLAGKKVEPSTVTSYWRNGLIHFFAFLVEANGLCSPDGFEPKHMRYFIGWLEDHDDWTKCTHKVRYDSTKSVHVGLVKRGIIANHPDLFPRNPFPGSNSKKKGETPLSPSERLRLAQALRDDIVALHKGTFTESASEALVVHVLALAIRTGLNPTPLLEMSRDCLRSHPFMPKMMLVETFKKRGNATHLKNLQWSRTDEAPKPIPIDGVALLKKVLALTAPLVGEAKPEHNERVWLYRSGGSAIVGVVTVLKDNTLGRGVRALVARHDLRDDADTTQRINLSRLRKTLETRLWTLSGGDLIATAALMGHDPKVADISYLACTNPMRENATFVGEAMPDIYRSGPSGERNVIPILPSPSPTGRCKDPYHGDKAPKNGEACDDFFSCFNCKSYAIVGSPEDLHRLFSFYWFLEREMLHARTNDWREQFRLTMLLIDAFTQDKFDADLIAAAKEKARVQPLKFWAAYTLSSPEVING